MQLETVARCYFVISLINIYPIQCVPVLNSNSTVPGKVGGILEKLDAAVFKRETKLHAGCGGELKDDKNVTVIESKLKALPFTSKAGNNVLNISTSVCLEESQEIAESNSLDKNKRIPEAHGEVHFKRGNSWKLQEQKDNQVSQQYQVDIKNQFGFRHEKQNNSTLTAAKTEYSQSNKTLVIGFENATVADRRPFKARSGKAEIRSSRLQFLDVPSGSSMRIRELHLDDELLLFEVFSMLIGYLYPTEYPLDLFRDAINEHIPNHVFIFQIFKLEGTVLAWSIFWVIIALALPFAVAAYLCCPTHNNPQRLREGSLVSLPGDFQDSCAGRTTVVYIHCLLIFIVTCILCSVICNETISKSLNLSTKTTELIFEDMEHFVKNTEMQMKFVATSSIEKTIDAIEKDLEDVETLLGKPYQGDLFKHTDIDTVLNALVDIQSSAKTISTQISELLAKCSIARNAGQVVKEKLEELTNQLMLVRKQCTQKDRPLCDTLAHSTNLTLVFSVDELMADMKLKYLEHLGKEKHFNKSVEEAVRTAQDIPKRVAVETSAQRAEIRRVLNDHKSSIYNSAKSLESLSRSLQSSIHSTSEYTNSVIRNVASGDLWRYIAVLGLSFMVFIAWMFLMIGAPCGCETSPRSKGSLLFGLSLSCLLTILLWVYGSISFVVGGHGHSIICRAAYDEPDYSALGQLLNEDGVLYGERGFFRAYIKGNDSIRVENVLRECRFNQTVYNVFYLQDIFDINTITNYESWTDYRKAVKALEVNGKSMFFFSPFLQIQVKELSSASNLNLTKYRTIFSRPVTNKDLTSFAEQLEVVALQLSHSPTSSVMRTLAYETRKLVGNEIRQLLDLRNNILYQITALELVLKPLHVISDQTQTQMDAIQFMLDNESYKVAKKHTKEYLQKIDMYLHDFQRHVSYMVTREISKCGPIWDVFQAMRHSLCKQIVDPINAYACSCYLLILLFLVIAPAIVKYIEYFRDLEDDEIFSSISRRLSSTGLPVEDEPIWATPTTESPQESIDRHVEESGWVSPRQPSEPLIPTPPRMPDFLSRITSQRIPTLTLSRQKSPRRGARYESLKLIERIKGRTPSGPSPRNWI